MQTMDIVMRWPSAASRLGDTDLMRYALRSVATYCPWARRILLVTPFERWPDWLAVDHPALVPVGHDAIMARFVLPTNNPHSVDSHLHRVPGISAQFVVMDAHTLILSPEIAQALIAEDGQAILHLAGDIVPSVAETASAAALKKRFSTSDWPPLAPGPLVLDAEAARAMCNDFAAPIAATRGNKSAQAGVGDVAPLFLAAHYGLATGRALQASAAETRHAMAVLPISGAPVRLWWRLQRLARRHPLSVTLQAGPDMQPQSLRIMEDWLDQAFPDPAPWEIG